MGFSLNDSYWYGANIHSGHLWKKLNCFENNFSEDIGQLLFSGVFCDLKNFCGIDPSVTTNGRMKKMWHNSGDKVYLFKGAQQLKTGGFSYQCINEAIASKVAEILDLKHVDYFLSEQNVLNRNGCEYIKMPVSICENFIDSNTEYIPISLFENLQNPYINDMRELEKIAQSLNISKQDFDNFTSKYIALSLIMLNTDFNKGNIGFVHDTTTNTYRFAPSFDIEASLGIQVKTDTNFNFSTEKMPANEKLSFKNVKESFNDCIKKGNKMLGYSYDDMMSNIRNTDVFDIEKIKSIPLIAKSIFAEANIDASLSKSLTDLITQSTNNFIQFIEFDRNERKILNNTKEEDVIYDVIDYEER